MRSMMEGFFESWKRTPPPAFGRSPSPAKAGEDFQARNVEKKTSPPAKVIRKSLRSSEAGIRRSISRG